MTLKEAQEKFLGKRVTIKDALGKSTTLRGEFDVTGVLTFLDNHQLFKSWGICATIGRTPMQNINLDNITLEE